MLGFPTWIPRSPDWMVLLASTAATYIIHPPEAAMTIFILYSARTRDVGISIQPAFSGCYCLSRLSKGETYHWGMVVVT